MYSLSQIWKGLRNPHYIVSEWNRLLNIARNRKRYNPDGIDIFSEDWDNLLILDACRYDEFARINTIPGELEARISRGSNSREFVRGNFSDSRLHDVVYVSANRYYAHMHDRIGAEVHEYIPTELDAPDVSSSLPETVTEAAIEAAERYPNKRLLVHYLQPHQPYFGPENDHLENRKDIHGTIEANDLSDTELREAYRKNLRYVLTHVEQLLEHLEGKTVISADHGELLGERERPIPMKSYGHPSGVYVDELVKVPWHVHEGGSRKRLVAEEPSETMAISENVDQTLRDLGYRV
ncbi:hypothetical protein Halru_1010 [Halovivax ruber XH-70]|uniref:Arylsulfatase A family protein n=1 Tax=Halovivax ruber (strain DSM 18193 / JCM 13892 / XH-70) TaxID=797302 RepID=L0IA70_HALRX|nr:hypothetical protein [Halovivax ruber]AGB15629.1 hypothetical protein Halru_1010 [Halovivax ruber XH-70]